MRSIDIFFIKPVYVNFCVCGFLCADERTSLVVGIIDNSQKR